MIPPSPSDSFASLNPTVQQQQPHPAAPQHQSVLLAYQMHDRLRRMSDDRKLNLSAEDVLISAYLGRNLVYRRRSDSEDDSDSGGKLNDIGVGVNRRETAA